MVRNMLSGLALFGCVSMDPLRGIEMVTGQLVPKSTLDWTSHPIPVYRDRYRLMETVQIWTVRFHETSIKFSKFSKII